MSDRIFVWVGHPRHTSLSRGLADAYQSAAEGAGAEAARAAEERAARARALRYDALEEPFLGL